MASGIVNNCYLINAPAGSGKTTTIKNMIKDILSENINPNILCITFTNRAADELNKDIDSKTVQIQTIHSFINSFIKIYFSHKEIINLYFECYESEIKKRIANEDNDSKIEESNRKYIDKYGKLDYETVKQNIRCIKYNELSFNSLYYGGLSHDELIKFSKYIIENYPKIKQRIFKTYNYIFIDEYQDTSADILKMFYNAVNGTSTKLYLFGDKMQQIYNNYDGSFEDKLKIFDQNKKLDTNYRSSKLIVNILNKIYNDPEFEQNPDEEKDEEGNMPPLVYICDNIEVSLAKAYKDKSDAMSLVVYNKKRFELAGSGELYDAVNNMEKYSFGRMYSAVDILTINSIDNPDDLFRLLFLWKNIYEDYKNKKYGLVIQSIKLSNTINSQILEIKEHKHKKRLNSYLMEIFNFFDSSVGGTIRDWLELIDSKDFFNKEILNNILNSDDYENVLEVPFEQFKNLSDYLEQPRISTQHGVKGEGHDKIFFVAEDSGNPSIKMYDFFNIWMSTDLIFTEIQDFYYKISQKINGLEKALETKLSKLKKNIYEDHREVIEFHIDEIYSKFKDNKYFINIYKDSYTDYYKKRNVSNVKKCLNLNEIYGVLSAYKIFYVGCSRAKKELIIFIDSGKIKGDRKRLEEKFIETGFLVCKG